MSECNDDHMDERFDGLVHYPTYVARCQGPSPSERELLRHACGMDSKDPYYRDYFAADPGSDDDVAWAAMVAQGLSSVRRQPDDLSPYRIYGVTAKGKTAIGKYDQGEVFGRRDPTCSACMDGDDCGHEMTA